MRLFVSFWILLCAYFIVQTLWNTAPELDEELSAAEHEVEEMALENLAEDEELHGIYQLIGKEEDIILRNFGQPTRVEPSRFGYNWWVYNEDSAYYMLVGIENNKIATIVVLGEAIDISPLAIGAKLSDMNKIISLEKEFSFKYEGTDYRVMLHDEDIMTKPLVKIGEKFIQLYVDTHTAEIASIRIMDKPTLLKLQQYEVTYRGTPLSAENTRIIDSMEKGIQQQIFEITNILRERNGRVRLKWDDHIAEVAKLHSQDMALNHYFAHESPTYGDLSDRLKAKDVFFTLAGENIAAEYTDSIDVVLGWLNSRSHRDILLNEYFTHLGVGFYEGYYTQNFVQLIEPL